VPTAYVPTCGSNRKGKGEVVRCVAGDGAILNLCCKSKKYYSTMKSKTFIENQNFCKAMGLFSSPRLRPWKLGEFSRFAAYTTARNRVIINLLNNVKFEIYNWFFALNIIRRHVA